MRNLIAADPVDVGGAVALVVRAVELAWRFGAFACAFVLVNHNSIVPNLDGRLVLLSALALFCFVPRLDLASLLLGLLVIGYLIQSATPRLGSFVGAQLSPDLALAWIAVGLVACAGVLHAMTQGTRHGLFDRDAALLFLGWGAAAQVWLATELSLNGTPPTIFDDPTAPRGVPAGRILFHGEAALFLSAGWITATAVMAGLGALVWWRTQRVQNPLALQSHAGTGAIASAVAYMTAGSSVPETLGSRPGAYQWFGAAIGAFVGLIVWLGFYVASANQHLRTWGPIRTLVLVSLAGAGLASLAISVVGLDAPGVIASFGILLMAAFFAWETWRRWKGTRRQIERGYAQGAEISQWLTAQIRRASKRKRPPSSGPRPRITISQVNAAVEELLRVRAVHAAATGHDFGLVVAGGEPQWREKSVPPLERLRGAARAGRWQVFWHMVPVHAGAAREMKWALKEVTALRRAIGDPPGYANRAL